MLLLTYYHLIKGLSQERLLVVPYYTDGDSLVT